MADSGKTPVKLDKTAVKQFLTEEVRPFKESVKKVLKEPNEDGVLPLPWHSAEAKHDSTSPIAGAKMPFAIGGMAGDASVLLSSSHLISSVTGMIDQVDEILKLQIRLFGDIEDGLEDTVHSLLKTQDGNLGSINGEKMVDVFIDVDDDLSTMTGGGDEL
ncbi:type VII secretion system-associated protein [Streptomyces sp. NBC_01275]|uniref:type VII secretion system-associated protein n=1 Tax=Streptomyces sp. NBC_01275 TaxID=2903807 RepID=UPI002258E58C|nr:type VII secretion system-associated protein [Streptomyces sp. NBC_01275]MCX4765867.1 type VII secretion system-associated protein [Streptomyces sp. NBC_01275]